MEGVLKLEMFICQLVFENSEHIFPLNNLVSGDWIFRPAYNSLLIYIYRGRVTKIDTITYGCFCRKMYYKSLPALI